MKKTLHIAFSAFVLLFLMLSCNSKKQPSSETEIASYADSTEYLMFNLDVELPLASDKVNANIRRDLVGVISSEIANLAGFETPKEVSSPDKDPGIDSLVHRLGSEAFASLNALAKEDDDIRKASPREVDAEFIFQWECMCTLSRIVDTERYSVYLSENYEYLGGAHGGISGAGYLTYGKTDGSRITGFIDSSKAGEMQDILRAGIVRYFADAGQEITEDEVVEYLFVEDGIIPLPSLEPYPSEDGLVFIYQQYEIAPYAMGMPQFTVSFQDLKPYLTEEAREALGL